MTSSTQVKSGFWNMPKSFYPIFMVEFWERFAWYGLQSVAVLFFIKKFGLKESQATDLFSSFSGIMYGLMLIGGILGDKVLGLRRTYLLGIIFLMIGYSSFYFTTEVSALYWGMGMVVVGNALFKTNAGNFVHRCFEPNDPRIDSAFTYFYMSINLGSFASMIIVPIIAEHYSYSLGIGLCGLGMMIALVLYFIFRNVFVQNDNQTGKEGSSLLKSGLVVFVAIIGLASAFFLGNLLKYPELSRIILFSVAGLTLIMFLIIRYRLESKVEKNGMMLVLILLAQSTFFWLLYMQMSTSLTLFAVHNVRTDFLGITIPPLVTQSFNPFFIFLLSPILATWYVNNENKGKAISIPFKFAIGTLVCGFAYILLAATCVLHDENGQVSMLWLFLSYGLYSLGELLISAIGLAMVSKLMPGRLGGFAQGVWFVTTAFGQKIGGILSGYAAMDNPNATNLESLYAYEKLFWAFGIGSTALAIIFIFFVKKLSATMNVVTAQIR